MDTNSVQRQTALVGDPSKRGVVYIPISGKEYDQKYIENRTDPVLYFDLDLLKKSLPEKSGYRYFVPIQYTAEGNRFRCTNHFFYFDFPDETYDHINEVGQLQNNKTFSFAFPDCPGRTYFYPLWGEPTIIVSEKKATLTAISNIMKAISHNNTQLSDEDLAEWILGTYIQRTKNHKSFVEAVASSVMKDYFGTQYNLYARYFDKILKHDNDKLDMTQPDMVASYAVNTVLMNPKHTNLYSVTDEAQFVFENVYWKKHYERNVHHPENWADWDQSTWKCSLDAFKKKFAEDPKEGFLAIAEMVTDWMAVGLEVGNTAKEWFAKANGQKWEWATEIVDELIIPMLAFEKPLYLSYETASIPLLKEDISTEAMSLESLPEDEKEMAEDKRFKQLVFLVKAVCHVKAYINPGSKLGEDLHITEKQYAKLAESVFRHFYCGKTAILPKYNPSMQFKTLAKWVINHLKEKPKDEVSTEETILSCESYVAPYTEKELREHGYSEEVISKLKNDPVHSWRMQTGIELIHREPSRSELNRIWKNWMQMTAEQQKKSDVKCLELFGYDNETLYKILISQYKVERPEKGDVKYPSKTKVSTEDVEIKSDKAASELVNKLRILIQPIVEMPYACWDFDNNKIAKPTSNFFSEKYKWQSVTDVEKHKCGVCWDISHYLANKLKSTGISNFEVYCEATDKNNTFPSHSFNVCCIDSEFFAIEAAWKSYAGVSKRFDNLVDLCKVYATRMSKQHDIQEISFYKLQMFPEEHANCERYMDVAKQNKEICHFSIADINSSNENLNVSNEAMQGEPSPKQKREKIIKLICDTCNKMEPEGKNAKRYRDWLGSMSDKEFDQFMQYMKEGKFQLFIVAPNMESNIKIENLLKAADFVGCNLFHRLWFTDSSTKRKYLSDNKYMILSLPIRRQQQFLDEKISVPENDKQIDGMTGQVTGDSKACSITNPEVHILAARNLDATLFEFLNVRGGNISGYNEFKRSLEENGEASLNDIDPNSRTRVSVVGNTLLKGLMIDNNL